MSLTPLHLLLSTFKLSTGFPQSYIQFWSRWRESNPRPAAYKTAALASELHRHIVPDGRKGGSTRDVMKEDPRVVRRGWHRLGDLNTHEQFWRLSCYQLHQAHIWRNVEDSNLRGFPRPPISNRAPYLSGNTPCRAVLKVAAVQAPTASKLPALSVLFKRPRPARIHRHISDGMGPPRSLRTRGT